MSLYIFLIYCFYHLTCLCNNFYGLSALVGCWSSAFIRRIIYTILKMYLLITRLLRLGGRFNHTSWVAIVTPTDRPLSVRNRCVIEVLGGVVCVVTLLFGLFCRFRGFCHRIESDLFLFLFISKTQFTRVTSLCTSTVRNIIANVSCAAL